MTETLFIWIMGGQTTLVIGLLSILWTRLSGHERRCGEWQRELMEEHGEIRADVRNLLARRDPR